MKIIEGKEKNIRIGMIRTVMDIVEPVLHMQRDGLR